jgi:hypothetical protein
MEQDIDGHAVYCLRTSLTSAEGLIEVHQAFSPWRNPYVVITKIPYHECKSVRRDPSPTNCYQLGLTRVVVVQYTASVYTVYTCIYTERFV